MITSTLVQPTGRTLFSFLRRAADDLYYNYAQSAFQVIDLLSANEGARAPFRIPYEENAGVYTWEIDSSTFFDGDYAYTSQELVGATEYAPIASQTLTLSGGDVAASLLTAEISQTASKTLFSFLKRNRDGLYYSPDLADFGADDMASAAEAVRATYRIPFAEDPPGRYSWEVDVSSFDDGTYTVSTRELVGSIEILAGEDYTVGVYNGAVASGASLGEVGINHDTGSRDALRYVTTGGAPIAGAKICVYSAMDDTVPIWVTFTNKYGRWESPVLVPVGASYTITFSKPGLYGPDNISLVL